MPAVPVVDAFTAPGCDGNPAGVVLCHATRRPEWMQHVAWQAGLSETAFVRARDAASWDLRWFTPTCEVDLCGHATLAAAYWLWENGHAPGPTIRFASRSGPLAARRCLDGQVEISLPAVPADNPHPLKGLAQALPGTVFRWIGQTSAPMATERNAVVLMSAASLRALAPDLTAMRRLPVGGVIATARSDDPRFDILSRYFAPRCGIDEDPVTGSAHCTLAPYWSPKFEQAPLRAKQLSARKGSLLVTPAGDRVLLRGAARPGRPVTVSAPPSQAGHK